MGQQAILGKKSGSQKKPVSALLSDNAIYLTTLPCLAVDHMALSSTKFKGYSFDRPTLIVPILSEVHGDPKVFPDPDKFDPGRFINDLGCGIQTTNLT